MTKYKVPTAIALGTYLTGNVVLANEAQKLEEVFVSAQKRSESILDVPIAIDVIGGEFIKKSGATGLSDLEFAIPAVNFGRGERKTRGEIVIRGVGDFSRNIGTEARAIVYIDDVPLGRSSAFDANIIDIKQIEVLKGPQGTLFGANTIAGAINITTEDPSDTFGLNASLDAGNFDHQRYALKTDIPLSDTLLSSVQASHTKSTGHIRNIQQNIDLQGRDQNAAKIKLLADVSDQFTLRANFDWLEESTPATNALAIANDGLFNGFTFSPSTREVAHDADEYEEREIYGASLKANYLFDSGYQLVSVTAYRYNEFEEQSEEDYSPLPVASSRFDEEYKQWSQEVRLLSDKDEKTDFVVGFYASAQESITERSANLLDFVTNTITTASTPGKLETTTLALFFNGNYRFTDSAELNTGLRAQSESKELAYEIVDGTGRFVNDSCEANALCDQDKSFSAFLPKVGINFDVGDTGMLYYSVARGSKSGGWNADFVTSLDNIDFDQEYALNFEVGYKGALLDNSLHLDIAWFRTKFSKFQVFQFVSENDITLIRLTNAGEATSQGFELDARMQVTPYMDIVFNTAYTDAVFDNFQDGGGPGIDYTGNTLPYAPELTAFTSLDFHYPVFSSSKVFCHLDYSYSDGYFSNPNNENSHQIDNFYTINGQLGIKDFNNISLYLWGKNLTDEEYLRYSDISFIQIPRGYYEKPRTYGITVSYSL